jgi:hypothetical protein
MTPGQTQLDRTQAELRAPFYRRIWILLTVLTALLLMAFLPPLINVNQYQKRITTSISESLGRPVHLDHINLTLLPIPGFTLENFVVSEDPAFGSEPTIRANRVLARLRVSSLWRRRIEFSTISLTEPSINLVHTAEGKWNVDSILLQAARLEAAPTEQRTAGEAPRFPYIEATGARLNLKQGNVKTPFSLTDADFALWLPDPQTWHLRIAGHPARTDLPVGFTGLLRVDGTLGRAPTFEQIPIDLHGEWRGIPLGEMSRIVLGRDAGWRGDLTLNFSTLGTVGNNRVQTTAKLDGWRRADFVPVHPLSFEVACAATAVNAFHSLDTVGCTLPAGAGKDDAALRLSGSLEDIRQHSQAVLQAKLSPTPMGDMVPLLQTVSARIPERLTLGGMVSGSLSDEPAGKGAGIVGNLLVKGGTIQASPDDKNPIVLGDLIFRQPAEAPAETGGRRRKQVEDRNLQAAQGANEAGTFVLQPTTIALGGKEPAMVEGRFDPRGYTLHLTGMATVAQLTELSAAIPQFGDGLRDALPQPLAAGPMRLDLTAMRGWGGPQTWHEAPMRAPAPSRKGRRRR